MKRALTVSMMSLLATAAASAQSYPGDTGAGTERGVQSVNNSGQVGTVTIFRRDPDTRVRLSLKGIDPNRVQSVRLYRGPSCDDLGSAPAYFLTDMRNGVSTTAVHAPQDKLLSGNYNVVVFSSNQAGARSTACGHLYA